MRRTTRRDVVPGVKPEVVLFNPLRSTLNFSPPPAPARCWSTSSASKGRERWRMRTYFSCCSKSLNGRGSPRGLHLGELQITPDCLESKEMGSYLAVVRRGDYKVNSLIFCFLLSGEMRSRICDWNWLGGILKQI